MGVQHPICGPDPCAKPGCDNLTSNGAFPGADRFCSEACAESYVRATAIERRELTRFLVTLNLVNSTEPATVAIHAPDRDTAMRLAGLLVFLPLEDLPAEIRLRGRE